MGVTERVSDVIATMPYASLSPEAVATVKRVALDGLGVTVAGSKEGPAVWNLMGYARLIGGDPVCSVVGGGFKTWAPTAAFVNGASCHVLDYEMMWNTHPTSTLLPGILALAEWKAFTGKDVIGSLAMGLEMEGRLRAAERKSNGGVIAPFELGMHFPGLVGAMGSAAACARILGLDTMRTRMALGMAASRVSGLFGNVGSDTKCQHCGHASRMGLESALLAQEGATASPDVLEARLGWVETFYLGGDTFDVAQVGEKFANPWRFLEDPPNIKRLPAHTFQQCGMEAAMELRRTYDINPSQVEELTIEGPVLPYVNRPSPRTGLEGKFSYQYTVAVAFLDGDVTVDSFHEHSFSRPQMQDLLGKVRLIENNTPLAGHEGKGMFREFQWKKVTARMASGKEYTARCDIAPGFVGGRDLSHDEHLEKVRRCITRALSVEKTERCIAILEGLEDATAPDIAELMELTRC